MVATTKIATPSDVAGLPPIALRAGSQPSPAQLSARLLSLAASNLTGDGCADTTVAGAKASGVNATGAEAPSVSGRPSGVGPVVLDRRHAPSSDFAGRQISALGWSDMNPNPFDTYARTRVRPRRTSV